MTRAGWRSESPGAGESTVQLYERFQRSIEVLREWDILPFDSQAAGVFENLQHQRLRVGRWT